MATRPPPPVSTHTRTLYTPGLHTAYVTTLPHGGRVGPPPYKEVAMTFNTATAKKTKPPIPQTTMLPSGKVSRLLGVDGLTRCFMRGFASKHRLTSLLVGTGFAACTTTEIAIRTSLTRTPTATKATSLGRERPTVRQTIQGI